MSFAAISSTVQQLQKWYAQSVKLNRVISDNSMSDLTQETKFEPLVIVSKDCIGLEPMNDIMQGVLNYTIADYAQLVNLYGKIDNIAVKRTLAAFNPNRSGGAGALLASINLESRSPQALKFGLPTGTVPTMEATNGNIPQSGGGKFSTKELQEEAKNMSVGKLVDVTFSAKDNTGKDFSVTMPIQFRLLTSFVNSSSLVNMITNGVDDTGFFARLERASDIGFSGFVDLITAQDMIEAKRKLLYSDDGKVLNKILARGASNRRAALASGVPTLAGMANIFIMTSAEATAIGSKIGRPLSSETARELVFKNVSAACLVVINSEWNQVTFWHRGYDSPVTLDFKQLKASAGGKGNDLMDMFRQFNLGMPVA